MKTYKEKLISEEAAPKDHARLRRVVLQLVGKNQDVDFFRSQKWTMWLVDTDDVNAMVVPVSCMLHLDPLPVQKK